MKPDQGITGNDIVEERQQRLDTWLWVSRFFKTRKLAGEAVKAGHVAVNGQRAKAAKLVRINDHIHVQRRHQEYTVIMLAHSDKRLGAQLAAALYQETDSSRRQREAKQLLYRQNRIGIKYDHRKPGKHDRRSMLKFKRQDFNAE
jgi:ribosome-associated heat shock protein Hsp15